MTGNDISLETENSSTRVPIIDAHVHAIPESLLWLVSERPTDGVSVHKAEGGWLVTLPGSKPKLVRPLMTDTVRRPRVPRIRDDRAGGVALAGRTADGGDEPAAGARLEPALNEGLAEQRRRPRGARHRPADPAAGADLRTAVENEGAVGLVLSTSPPGAADLADPVLEPLWEAAVGLGVPVVLHPPTDGPSSLLPGSAEFGNTFCRLVDTTFAVTTLLLSGVLDRHPGLALVVVHGGGFLPYQSMRLDGGHRADALARYTIERDRPSDYLADLYFDSWRCRR